MQIQHTKNLIPGRFELGTTLSQPNRSNTWPPGLSERNNNKKVVSFSALFFMFTLTWITEKELERVIEKKGDEFRRKKQMEIQSGGEKMRNASRQQGEKWAAVKKKANRNTSSKMFCEQIRLRFLHKPYARVLYVLLFALEKLYHDSHHPQVITPTDNFKYLKRSALFC